MSRFRRKARDCASPMVLRCVEDYLIGGRRYPLKLKAQNCCSHRATQTRSQSAAPPWNPASIPFTARIRARFSQRTPASFVRSDFSSLDTSVSMSGGVDSSVSAWRLLPGRHDDAGPVHEQLGRGRRRLLHGCAGLSGCAPRLRAARYRAAQGELRGRVPRASVRLLSR